MAEAASLQTANINTAATVLFISVMFRWKKMANFNKYY